MVMTMMCRFSPFGAFLLAAALVACANERRSLPGDSVSSDGGITLSPPRLSTAPAEVREAQGGLGPIETRLFSPELVMEHQGELAITEEQQRALLAEMERGQSAMLHLQWELQGEKEKLVKLLDAERVDEAKVQEAAARVMDRETKVKASHLGMLVRVKNLLTGEQQAKLRDIRAGVRTASVADAGSAGGGRPAQTGRRPDAAP
jgi:Spy/CpxP family protein refolding chaperone